VKEPVEQRQPPNIGQRIVVDYGMHRGKHIVSEGNVISTHKRWDEGEGKIGARVIEFVQDDGRNKVVAVSSHAWQPVEEERYL